MFEPKDTMIFKDVETGQLVRTNCGTKVCKQIVDKSENHEFRVHYKGKDVTDMVANLVYDSRWSIDDWMKGWCGRKYLTDDENRQCAFKMSTCKFKSITITEYLMEKENERNNS